MSWREELEQSIKAEWDAGEVLDLKEVYLGFINELVDTWSERVDADRIRDTAMDILEDLRESSLIEYR